MALFNFFNKKRQNVVGNSKQLENVEQNLANVETSYDEPSTRDSQSKDDALKVSIATGWPIDLIYGYLHKNYESKGYEDAMLNSNLAFRDLNKNIIRNKILMVFKEINLNYDTMRDDLETRIDTCNAAGLLTNLAELNKQMNVINAHKSELAKMEEDFRNNANEASVPLMSYECGFLRGVSSITMATSSKTQNLKTPVVPTLSNDNILS